MESIPVSVSTKDLISIGQNVLVSITDAQQLGCATCLCKSDGYVVVVGVVFDLEKSPDVQFNFSAVCGDCFEAAREYGKKKRG